MSKPVFVIIAPNSMAFRAVVSSDVLPLLYKKLKQQLSNKNQSEESSMKILLLGPNNEMREFLPDYVEWRDYLQPSITDNQAVWWRKVVRSISVRFSKWFGFGYANTVFRFNQLEQFYAHQFKQRMSVDRQKREELAGNFVNKKYGFPFPNSTFLYRLIYKFYYAIWQVPDPSVEQFFNETSISKLIFWHAQNEIYRDYSNCARRQGIPITAVVGSWDRLTTKGPICPGCRKFVVNSQVMKQELMQHHAVNEQAIDVVGWPQMDNYHDKSKIRSRESFLKSLKVPAAHRVILYAGNASRLGAHEPGLVAYIAEQLNARVYEGNVYLLIRPHPQDVDWQQRYEEVRSLPNVLVMPAEMNNIELMVNVIIHADIVIATQGSISLDAVALDKCVINVAFDGNLNRLHHESVSRWYEMDHYRPVVESGGVRVVNNFKELDKAVIDYLRDQTIDAAGRERLRYLQLSPFEGDSSQRQVDAMIS